MERDFQDYKKRKLSQSSSGLGILVPGTALASRVWLHIATPSAAANEWDEVFLYATNPTANSAKLTLLWGWTNDWDKIILTIPAQSGLVTVVPGLLLQNNAEVSAWADTANAITIHGYVHRYELTP